MPPPRLAAAVRFGLAIAVVNLGASALFGLGATATAASFAAISVLYFLDYDGSARERLGGFAVSSAVACIGIVVGALAETSVVTVGIAAFASGFLFAVARAYRGLVARSFVGAQLGFVLAIFTHHAPAGLPGLLTGWLFGSAVAIAAALVLFPRQHTGLLRRALAAWCLAAAAVLRASAAGRPAAVRALLDRDEEVRRLDPGSAIAGLWSRRTRALAAMQLLRAQLSDLLRIEPVVADGGRGLEAASAAAFERAADLVRPGAARVPLVPLVPARDADAAADVAAFARAAAGDPAAAATDAAARLDARVLSIGAGSLQELAAASQGWREPGLGFAFQPRLPLRDLARRATSWESVWPRSGLRTGLAMAGAAVYATLLGVEHGVWVVMAALTVIAVTASPGGAWRRALATLLGVAAGIVVSAALVGLVHDWAVWAVLVPVLAAMAKWCAPAGGFLGQVSYTPFAVANVAMLSWPSAEGLSVVRFEDIAAGLVVAVLATLLTFPFGMRDLIERAWRAAREATVRGIDDALAALRAGAPLAPTPGAAQARAFADHADAVDAAFAGTAERGAEADRVAEHQRWLGLGLLCRIGIAGLARPNGAPLPEPLPGLLAPMETAPAVQPASVAATAAPPRDVLTTLWALRAVTLLRRAEPS